MRFCIRKGGCQRSCAAHWWGDDGTVVSLIKHRCLINLCFKKITSDVINSRPGSWTDPEKIHHFFPSPSDTTHTDKNSWHTIVPYDLPSLIHRATYLSNTQPCLLVCVPICDWPNRHYPQNFRISEEKNDEFSLDPSRILDGGLLNH
jgi:hypothetical protein